MLVLSRKLDESIRLKREGAEDIVITVVRIDNRNRVRLGIKAAKDVVVLRSEIDGDNGAGRTRSVEVAESLSKAND